MNSNAITIRRPAADRRHPVFFPTRAAPGGVFSTRSTRWWRPRKTDRHTCDTYPKEIAGMEERLISRFGVGLTLAIEPPELEMRVAIVLKKAEADSSSCRRHRVFHRQGTSAPRYAELEGALKKVSLSRDSATASCRSTWRRKPPRHSQPEQPASLRGGYQKTVAEYSRSRWDMHSKKRSRNVARPRPSGNGATRQMQHPAWCGHRWTRLAMLQLIWSASHRHLARERATLRLRFFRMHVAPSLILKYSATVF